MQEFIRKYQENLPDFMRTMKIKNGPTRYLPKPLAITFERYKGYQNDRRFMMFDCDTPTIAAHNIFDIEPNFIVYNPENQHFQAFWSLTDPVHCQAESTLRAPYRYLRAIESAYDQHYGGDHCFGRHIHRNPLFHSVDTDWRHTRSHKLAELASVVELGNYSRGSSHADSSVCMSEDGIVQKNNTLFNEVRSWSYRNACNHTEYDSLLRAILTRTRALNVWVDQDPLPMKECSYIAKSVADFMFYKYRKPGTRVITDEFRKKQAKRGAVGGKKSKGGGRPGIDEKLIAEIRLLRNVHKYSIRKIADELGISKTAVSKYAE